MLDRVITHLEWMIKALKQQHDNIPIGGGDSDEMKDAIALLEELRLCEDGVILSNRTRRDIIRVAKSLSLTPDNAEYGKALLADFQEEGISLDLEEWENK